MGAGKSKGSAYFQEQLIKVIKNLMKSHTGSFRMILFRLCFHQQNYQLTVHKAEEMAHVLGSLKEYFNQY